MLTNRMLLAISAMLLVGGCARVASHQQQVVSRASQIKGYPVCRESIIKYLDLGALPSQRVGGGVRGGYMWFIETWQLPEGLKVTAWDSEYVGAVKITERSIDDILNDPNRTRIPGTPGDFINPFPETPPRQTFKRITVSTARDKLIFDSTEPKMKNDEQAVDGNPH